MLRRVVVVSLCVVIAASAFQTITALAPAGTDIAAPAAGPSSHPANAALTQAGLVANLRPVRLVIPSIHLDAAIEARGLDASRNLDTAQDIEHAAWYDRGPAPGQAGNALINGHVNWWTGDAVFMRLKQVRLGDKVQVVRADGTSVFFTVSGRQTVPANARVASLFAPSLTASLTLITCTGVWNPLTLTDTQRLLVSARLA
jgi:LPXTG-site transpeptidase (sortase) family protein